MRDPHAIIETATAIAAEHHEGQLHGKGTAIEMPMLVHTMEVAVATLNLLHLVSGRIAAPPHVLFAAGLLHDVPEDTVKGRHAALDQIKQGCGEEVHLIVERITDVEAETRAASKALTLPRIARCVDTTYVKACDRYVNHRSTIAVGSVRFARLYGAEYEGFKATLEPALPVAALWRLLDDQAEALARIVAAHEGERRLSA